MSKCNPQASKDRTARRHPERSAPPFSSIRPAVGQMAAHAVEGPLLAFFAPGAVHQRAMVFNSLERKIAPRKGI
jgi:hypothetical protein